MGTASRAMSRNGYSYAEGNPANYTDPSGQFVEILGGIAVGAALGATLGGLSAEFTYDESLAGNCGCDRQAWAKHNNKADIVGQAVVQGAAMGALMGALATIPGLDLLLSVGGIDMGLLQAGRAYIDMLQHGANPCNAYEMFEGLEGVVLGMKGAIDSTASTSNSDTLRTSIGLDSGGSRPPISMPGLEDPGTTPQLSADTGINDGNSGGPLSLGDGSSSAGSQGSTMLGDGGSSSSGQDPTLTDNSGSSSSNEGDQGGGSCGANSFSANTLVETPNGETPISQLHVGDKVLAYNEQTGTIGSYTIDAVLVHTDLTLVDLTINGETIRTTPEHPFYTQERGWVVAGDLKIGDHVRKEDASYGVVQGSKMWQMPQTMYNLTVDQAHTFFVGVGQWLVHNANWVCPPDVLKSLKRLFKLKNEDGSEIFDPTRGECERCAKLISGLFKDTGIDSEIVRIETGGEKVIGTVDGRIIADRRGVSEAPYHVFVRVYDTIFDALTGPKGMSFEDYKNFFGGEKLWDRFFPNITISKP